MEAENKDIITLKAPLDKLLRNQNHLAIYHEMVDKVHRITIAAYLLVGFILIHSYEADCDFNADVFTTTTFFPECLYSLQTERRAAARADDTIRNRNLINGYLANFRQMYNY
jgi:hypothetical protein